VRREGGTEEKGKEREITLGTNISISQPLLRRTTIISIKENWPG